MYGRYFSIYGVHIPKKHIELCIFTHVLYAHWKRQVELFGNLFENSDLLRKLKNPIRKYDDGLEH